jgi:hypothetical protein
LAQVRTRVHTRVHTRYTHGSHRYRHTHHPQFHKSVQSDIQYCTSGWLLGSPLAQTPALILAPTGLIWHHQVSSATTRSHAAPPHPQLAPPHPQLDMRGTHHFDVISHDIFHRSVCRVHTMVDHSGGDPRHRVGLQPGLDNGDGSGCPHHCSSGWYAENDSADNRCKQPRIRL